MPGECIQRFVAPQQLTLLGNGDLLAELGGGVLRAQAALVG